MSNKLVAELRELLAKGWYEPGDYSILATKADAWIKRVREIGPALLDEYEVSGDAVGGGDAACLHAKSYVLPSGETGPIVCPRCAPKDEYRASAPPAAPRIPTASHDAARERAYRLAYAPLRSAQHALDIIARRGIGVDRELASAESERIEQAIASLDSPDAILAALPTTDGAIQRQVRRYEEASEHVRYIDRHGDAVTDSNTADAFIDDICELVRATPPTTNASPIVVSLVQDAVDAGTDEAVADAAERIEAYLRVDPSPQDFIEPTRKMLAAGAAAAQEGPWPDNVKHIWAAMQAASPTTDASERMRQAWQSIDSAPRDGTEFQAWATNDNGLRFWNPRCRFDPDSAAFQIWGRVDYDEDGWDTLSHVTPTHWAPDPSDPSQQGEG